MSQLMASYRRLPGRRTDYSNCWPPCGVISHWSAAASRTLWLPCSLQSAELTRDAMWRM